MHNEECKNATCIPGLLSITMNATDSDAAEDVEKIHLQLMTIIFLVHYLWSNWLLSLSLFEFFDFVLVIGMVWVHIVQKVEFGIIDFILSDTSLELWPIACNEAGSFINNVWGL